MRFRIQGYPLLSIVNHQENSDVASFASSMASSLPLTYLACVPVFVIFEFAFERKNVFSSDMYDGV